MAGTRERGDGITITVEGIHDLANWSLSKACNGWRANRQCVAKETGALLPTPHAACIQAQKANDLLGSMRRYQAEEVVGWLVTDDAVDLDLWEA